MRPNAGQLLLKKIEKRNRMGKIENNHDLTHLLAVFKVEKYHQLINEKCKITMSLHDACEFEFVLSGKRDSVMDLQLT